MPNSFSCYCPQDKFSQGMGFNGLCTLWPVKVYTSCDTSSRFTFMKRTLGIIGSLWGIGGVLLLLGSAVYRLSVHAITAFSYALGWHHWLCLVAITVLMSYAEGYRGFQQRFSPRVASRARYLREHPRFAFVILAPFFCMGYFHATRRRQITSLALTFGIILLVLTVRLLPQPWRGIVDIGVVVGLAWGILSLLAYSARAFRSNEFPYSPEVPEETAA